MKNNSTLSQLGLQIWVSCPKFWLNFQELPFSNRYQRAKTKTNLTSETKFPLLGHLNCISICPEWIYTPKAKVISLLLSLGILVHFPLTVGLHQLTSVLGYPKRVWKEPGVGVGYPSTPLSNWHPTVKPKCASLSDFTRRWILGRPRVYFQCRQFVRVVDS